jgi:hypothetical protein
MLQNKTFAFALPSMVCRPRSTIYAEAESASDLYRLLAGSAYAPQIRASAVAVEELYALIRYLLKPSGYLPLTWVRIKDRTKYKGQLGLITGTGSLILAPLHKTTNGTTPTENPFRSQTVPSRNKPQFWSLRDEAVVESKIDEFGLLSLEVDWSLRLASHLTPGLSRDFIDEVEKLMRFQHPDIGIAWRRVWQMTWRNGCRARTWAGEHVTVCSLDRTNGLADLDSNGIHDVALKHLDRVFYPGEVIVVGMGPSKGKICHVLQAVVPPEDVTDDMDPKTCKFEPSPTGTGPFLEVFRDDELDKKVDISSIYIRTDFALDIEYERLFIDTVESERSLRRTSKPYYLIGKIVHVVNGPLKGYDGTIVEVGPRLFSVEIPGLVEQKIRQVNPKFLLCM